MAIAYEAGATGNGNINSVSVQDVTKGLNTLRTVAYTSFDMPASMAFQNVGAGTCPAGYTLSGGQCTTVTGSVPATITGYTCPSGYTLSGSTCYSTSSVAATPVYQCPAGYTLSGTTCSAPASAPATATPYCPSTSFTYNASTQTCNYIPVYDLSQCQATISGVNFVSYTLVPQGPEVEVYYCKYTRLIAYSSRLPHFPACFRTEFFMNQWVK